MLPVRIFGTSNSSVGFNIFLKTKADMPIGLFFKTNFLVLDALQIVPNLALKSNDLFLDLFEISPSSFG